ncbi:hypothetical protein [uncultured Selenomonas sp.]|uniref:hypothetical protein n=1 Tax=uncultured Selenomonas sp. TaxID=159275 RepID=UPI0028D5052D|nr:hypothetical protein [uncultured Selenomonas sp.]
MKKTVTMRAAGKAWELCFTIRTLAAFERSIGKSVISLFAGGIVHMVEQMDIDATIAGLRCALSLSEDEAYNVADEICAGGKNLDYINGKIVDSIRATGLFEPIAQDEEGQEDEAGKS